ncbi:cuticle protein 14-like [Parasteatoda tepidariorum]|uniref:cuticle protein 14-like n=1 Tax=Parasteatoda tepidariorum TaxID=114398 RepID=UPI001C718277|nr:glycine-rich cell wall structural protein-like [Parasteatoda tepidariorum]
MISQVVILSAITLVAFAHPPVDHGHHAPKPYKFGYSVKDKHGEQHKEESGAGGHVTGSYGFTDDRGIHRQVNYVADHGGFRAQVKTNEPGTANQNPAAVHIHSSAPAHGHLYGGYAGYGHVTQGHGYAGNAGLGYGYGGYGGLGYNGLGYNGLGYGAGYGGYGLASALLGTLPYARYGY